MRVAQSLLFDRSAEKQHQTCWCHRSITTAYGTVNVYRTADGKGARFAGVATCGAVWTCPVCCAKVAEHRRAELSGAMVRAAAQGLHAYLLSLTHPHTREDDLAVQLVAFQKALTSFKNSRRFKAWSTAIGRIGSVRSLEVTIGENGWHPHTHDLIWANPGALGDRLAVRRLRGQWLRALVKAGLVKSGTADPRIPLHRLRDAWKHGLDLRGGDRAAEYVAKFGRDERWGLSSELTAMHAKVGFRKVAWAADAHLTPFQLLEFARNGDREAMGAFREYAQAFNGKRMLSWSRGLRDRLEVEDAADEQLAARPLGEEQHVAELQPQDFRLLIERNALGRFLDFVAESCTDVHCSQDDVDRYLAWMREHEPPSLGGAFRVRSKLGVGGFTIQP